MRQDRRAAWPSVSTSPVSLCPRENRRRGKGENSFLKTNSHNLTLESTAGYECGTVCIVLGFFFMIALERVEGKLCSSVDSGTFDAGRTCCFASAASPCSPH